MLSNLLALKSVENHGESYNQNKSAAWRNVANSISANGHSSIIYCGIYSAGHPAAGVLTAVSASNGVAR